MTLRLTRTKGSYFPGEMLCLYDIHEILSLIITKVFDLWSFQVTEGVHMAIGFAIANSILLEGPEGLVIVDTTESIEAAREILQHFRNISSKPIVAVVYTHSHADHCTGTKVRSAWCSHVASQYTDPRFFAGGHDKFHCIKKMCYFGQSKCWDWSFGVFW